MHIDNRKDQILLFFISSTHPFLISLQPLTVSHFLPLHRLSHFFFLLFHSCFSLLFLPPVNLIGDSFCGLPYQVDFPILISGGRGPLIR